MPCEGVVDGYVRGCEAGRGEGKGERGRADERGEEIAETNLAEGTTVVGRVARGEDGWDANT